MSDGELELLPEDELIELFRPRRPDARAFREGVERRIEELERRREAERRHPLQASVLRRAAALIGAEPAAGTAGGKLAGFKTLSSALAIPALLLAATLGSFLTGARSLRRSAREAVPPEPGRRIRRRPESAPILAVLRFVGLGVFFAPFLLGARFAIDAVLLVLLLSMSALAALVRWLAEDGALVRSEVRRLCGAVLGTVISGTMLWLVLAPTPDSVSDLGSGWSQGVLLVGFFFFVAPRVGRLVAGLSILVYVLLLNPLGFTRSSPAALEEQLPELDLRVGSIGDWKEAGAIVTALRAVGEEPPGFFLLDLRTRVERAIEGGAGASPVVWTAAARMGLIDADHWRILAGRKRGSLELRVLLGPNGRLDNDHDFYEIPMLLAARELTPAEQERLVASLERSWPEEDGYGALEEASLCVQAFDAIGRPDLAEAHREDVARLLRRRQVVDVPIFGRPGGFTPDPEELHTSFEGPTWEAIRLLLRYGPPPGVDLRLLRGYLRMVARAEPLFFEPFPGRAALPRASLLVLERAIGLSPRSLLEQLLGERLLLATIAIVALCLLASRLAPPDPRSPEKERSGGG